MGKSKTASVNCDVNDGLELAPWLTSNQTKVFHNGLCHLITQDLLLTP